VPRSFPDNTRLGNALFIGRNIEIGSKLSSLSCLLFTDLGTRKWYVPEAIDSEPFKAWLPLIAEEDLEEFR
jgi:hypothetical protein